MAWHQTIGSQEVALPQEEIDSTRLRRPRQELKMGFSTGTAAAAAAQGALRKLLDLPCPAIVEVCLPCGGSLAVPLLSQDRKGSQGEAVVVKDAGDDPDATHGAEIGARVWLSPAGSREAVILRGGTGVGRVTKPGLPVAVGEPAINPVPRRMLHQTCSSVWQMSGQTLPMRLTVEIFVPRGEEIARHTLNPRLGIRGGISILGTTGLVKPFSHQAYRATIVSALKVAQAVGLRHAVLTTGGKSEEHLKQLFPHLPEEAFVQMGDYVRFSLKAAVNLGFHHLSVGAFLGKALKMAQGFGNTHASHGLASFRKLGCWTEARTGNPILAQAVARAHTARQVLEILPAAQSQAVVGEVGRRMLAALQKHAGPGPELAAVILDFDGHPLFWANSSEGLL
ncbi:MAG: cobalt-precorrin-5B (C(1))-methyltransferase [Desulfobacca sp.]|nr:cobalt-precorrin-5B (C(1))-methyltransferase [Desulfobacca sp.]